MEDWGYSALVEGKKNNFEWVMVQFPSLVLAYSSVFLFPWVFDYAKAFSNSVLKQFW